MRLIDADALIENFGKLTVELWLDSVEEAEIVSLIGNAPTIEPKRGEWKVTAIKAYKGDILMGGYCSVCGYENHHFDYKFCPNCGASMRERKESE